MPTCFANCSVWELTQAEPEDQSPGRQTVWVLPHGWEPPGGRPRDGVWPSSGFLPDALISLDRNCPPVHLPARDAHGTQNLDSAEWQLVTANDRRTRAPATRQAQNLPSVLPRILRRKD